MSDTHRGTNIDELNPNHPVTAALREQWHKLCAVLVHKTGKREVVVTGEDLEALTRMFGGEMPCLLAHTRADGIYLSLLPESEARKKGMQ